jgi:hypothetical protein
MGIVTFNSTLQIRRLALVKSAGCLVLEYVYPVWHYRYSKKKAQSKDWAFFKVAPQHGLEPRTQWLTVTTSGFPNLLKLL